MSTIERDTAPVPKSVASALLCNELYGANDVSNAKTFRAASSFFEKAGVFVDNCNATFHYGFILPLKEKTIGLTENEAVYLEVYRKHTTLCSGIEKVQTAYKSYIAAQEAVNNAPKSSVVRKPALTAGNELVNAYDALIQLAISQGDGQIMSLNDLHEELESGELDGKTQRYIYNTVNMIRAKGGIESHYTDKQELKDNYIRFVTEFVSNIREASRKSGNSDSEGITDAFIQGLASIPELGELDDGLVLIELYDELSIQQGNVAVTQNEAVEYFREQIEGLMNRREPITDKDLQKIQFKGISLLSVMPTLNAEQLNKLNELGGQLKSVQRDIQRAETTISEIELNIAESSKYSFKEVNDFLKVAGGASFEGIPQEDTVFGNLARSYTEGLKTHASLTQQINETEGNQAQAKQARVEEITENQVKLKEMNDELNRLKDFLEQNNTEIDVKQQKLQRLQTDIEEEKKKLSGEKDSDIKKMKIAGFEQQSQTALATLKDEIRELLTSRSTNMLAYGEQQNKSTDLGFVVADLIEADGEKSEQEAKVLQALRTDLTKLEGKTIAELTGEELNDLATQLKIMGRVISLNPIAVRLDGVVNNKDRVEQLTNDLLPRCQKEANKISEKMAKSFLTLNDEQAFVVAPAMFGDDERSEVKAQLEANLVIAKKVTMEVGREIVRRDDEKDAQDTGRKSVLKRVSTLQLGLDDIENKLNEKSFLSQLVSNGLKKLAPVVSKKPAEVVLVNDLGNVDANSGVEYLSLSSDEDSNSENDIFGRQGLLNDSTLIVDSEDEI